MVATAAHLSDHVLPPLPLRQWVPAVPKRLRYFLHDDAVLQGVVVRILLRAVERRLRAHSPGCTGAARLGALVLIHRFGSSLKHQHDAGHLIYDIPKPRPDGPRAVVLTLLDLLDKVAAMVPAISGPCCWLVSMQSSR